MSNEQIKEEPMEYGVFWGDSLRDRLSPKQPIIDHLLYSNDTICISADAGVGKTILGHQLLCCLTTGRHFLDTYEITKPYNVLYLQTEGDRAETIDRLAAMAAGLGIDDSRWVHMNLDGLCLNTATGLTQFLQLSDTPKMTYDVIIVDPIYTTVKGSLSSDEVTTDWVRSLRTIRKKYNNCAYILLHHEGKDVFQQGSKIEKRADSLFGSTFWAAFVTYNFKLSIKGGVYTLTLGKRRNTHVIDELKMRLIEPFPLMYVHADADSSFAAVQVKALLEANAEPMMARDIMAATELSKASVYRVIKKLIKEGCVESIEVNKNTYFRYCGTRN